MSDTPTPRTDAAESNWWSEDGLRSAFIVRADFARELEREIARITAERDEARRMYCKAVADHYEYACNAELDGAGPYTQKDVAKDEGWDCYKEETK